MNYEKLTVERFGQNLKEGKYETATGARRAIGKATWTEKEKERARGVVEKHFGADAKHPAVKAAAAKPKKAAVKTAKKAATAKKRAVAAPQEVNLDEAPTPKKTREPIVRGLEEPKTLQEALQFGNEMLDFVERARTMGRQCQAADPNFSMVDNERDLFNITQRATRLIAKSTESLAPTEVSNLPPPRIAVPKSVEKNQQTTVPAAKGFSPPATGGTELRPAPESGASNLTEEERATANALRTATPVSGLASLPRPMTIPNG